MEVISFNVREDFKIKTGKEDREITIPRLLFKNTRPIFELISAIITQDAKASFKIIQEAAKVQTALHKKSFESFSKAVELVMPQIIREKNYDKIAELLKLVSEGVLTKEIVEDMQYNEACDLLAFLLNKNFESLKNLSASLQAMNMSVRNENE